MSTILLFYSFINCLAQATENSVIIDTAITFIKPDKFYISGVIDSRNNKAIDNFYLGSIAKNTIFTTSLSLHEILKSIINRRLITDSSLAPVIINIKDFSILTKDSSGLERDQLKIDFRFQSALDDKNIDFAFYTFSQELYKYMKSQKYYASVLQKELPYIIEQLNRVINNTYNDFPYKGVKIINTMRAEDMHAPDTIFYTNAEKLLWKDFKGEPDRLSDASAATSSSYLYSASAEIADGCKVISINTQCYFLKNKSWVKSKAVAGHILNHEQLHFDIAYLWALKFSNAINKQVFTMKNWGDVLDKLNTENVAGMVSMQGDYDKESDNGQSKMQQLYWEKKVAALIKDIVPQSNTIAGLKQ